MMGQWVRVDGPLKEKGELADALDMKPHRVQTACFLILVGIAWAPVQAQDADQTTVRSKILALEHAWNQAEPAKDLKALDVLFDNALIYIDFDGTLMTKSDFLARVKAGRLQQVVTQSMAVELFGNTAIVTGIYQSREVVNGKPLVRRGRFLDAWVYKDHEWVCVAVQSTPILP